MIALQSFHVLKYLFLDKWIRICTNRIMLNYENEYRKKNSIFKIYVTKTFLFSMFTNVWVQ